MACISSVLINFAYFVNLCQTFVNLASTKNIYLAIRSSLCAAGRFIHERTFQLRHSVHKREQHMRESCPVSAALHGLHQLRRDGQFPRAFTAVMSDKMSADLLQSELLVRPGLE